MVHLACMVANMNMIVGDLNGFGHFSRSLCGINPMEVS